MVDHILEFPKSSSFSCSNGDTAKIVLTEQDDIEVVT